MKKTNLLLCGLVMAAMTLGLGSCDKFKNGPDADLAQFCFDNLRGDADDVADLITDDGYALTEHELSEGVYFWKFEKGENQSVVMYSTPDDNKVVFLGFLREQCEVQEACKLCSSSAQKILGLVKPTQLMAYIEVGEYPDGEEFYYTSADQFVAKLKEADNGTEPWECEYMFASDDYDGEGWQYENGPVGREVGLCLILKEYASLTKKK